MNAVVVEGGVERVDRDVRQPGRDRLPSRPASSTASPPNVRWSTNRSSRPPSVKVNRARRCVSSGSDGFSTSSWPLMPRWPTRARAGRRAVGLGERQPEVLAAPVRGGERCGRSARRRSASAPSRCRRTARGWCDLDGGDGAAGDPLLQAAPDHLDLGQLGHGVRPRTAQRAPGGLGGLLLGGLLGAAGAACRRRCRPGRRRR